MIEDYFNCSQFCLAQNLQTTDLQNANFRARSLLTWSNQSVI